MSDFLKLGEKLNEWRDERRRTVLSQRTGRIVRVKGHEVMVTYRRRPVMRRSPRLGGS